MRLLLLLAVVAVLAPAAAAAPAQPTTTLTTARPHIGYGHSTTLVGRLSSGTAGTTVTIYARPFNAAGSTKVASVRSGANGHWTYAVKPLIATTYQASAGGAPSQSLMIRVRPTLTLAIAPSGAIVAHVQPTTLRGRSVQLQHETGSGTWSTLTKQPVGPAGTATFSAAKLPTNTTHLRLVMSVNQAGVGYLGGFSQPIVYTSHTVTLAKTPVQVGYGHSLRLSGTISLPKAGVPLEILARPFMQHSYQQVATVQTGTGGTWTYQVTPPFTTSYVARWGNGQTRVLTVGVRPAMTARLIANGQIWGHVGLAKSVTGKRLELQQKQADGTWKTVATKKLDAKATAVFSAAETPQGASTLRTAISVNQVGAGFLGGFSAPFTYQR